MIRYPPFLRVLSGGKLLWLSIAILFLWTVSSAHAAGLTESTRLADVYDTILHARFDQARTELARTCPPAPTESCLALAEVVLWWEIQLDPGNRSLDKNLQGAATAAIDAARRWTEREPQHGEAWFYLAAAHAPLEQWRILRGQKLAAGRDAIVSNIVIEDFATSLRAGSHLVVIGSQHELLMEQDRYRSQFWAAFDAFVPGTPLF